MSNDHSKSIWPLTFSLFVLCPLKMVMSCEIRTTCAFTSFFTCKQTTTYWVTPVVLNSAWEDVLTVASGYCAYATVSGHTGFFPPPYYSTHTLLYTSVWSTLNSRFKKDNIRSDISLSKEELFNSTFNPEESPVCTLSTHKHLCSTLFKKHQLIPLL